MSKQLSDKEFTQEKALWPFLKRMLQQAQPYRRWLWGVIFWAAVVAICDSIFPLLLQQVIDNAIAPEIIKLKAAEALGQSYAIDYTVLYGYIWIFAGLGVLAIIGVLIFIYYAGRIQEYIMYDLRRAMFLRIQKLSFSFYDRSASGWLLSRFTSDTDRVAEVISWGLLELIWGLGMMLFCVITVLIINWKLGLIILLAIPIMLVASIRIRMLVLRYSRKARQVNSDLTAGYTEHVNGIVVNKTTAQEERVGQEFMDLSNKMRKVSFRAAMYTALYIPVVLLVGSFAAALVLYWGGSMALAVNTGLTVGALIAAFDYATKIFIPIVDISMFYSRVQSCLSAGERVFSLIDELVEIEDSADATDFDTLQGAIEFQNLDFSYLAGQVKVLENFNLRIEAGQSIALVGATGEGKSTIANLVARFYQPTAGKLLVDGEDYTQKTLKSLRSQMGIVMQTPHLFKGTIRDNICYGQPNATTEEILSALELVGALNEFQHRLEEEIGEEGGQLSMGERQLLSFARAVLVNPRIFIMDEATSSIDTITEAKIQKSIAQMLEGRTSIIIAHRLSTIKHCDRILVIDEGRILEDGSHKELIAQKGKYFELYTKQLRTEKVITE